MKGTLVGRALILVQADCVWSVRCRAWSRFEELARAGLAGTLAEIEFLRARLRSRGVGTEVRSDDGPEGERVFS